MIESFNNHSLSFSNGINDLIHVCYCLFRKLMDDNINHLINNIMHYTFLAFNLVLPTKLKEPMMIWYPIKMVFHLVKTLPVGGTFIGEKDYCYFRVYCQLNHYEQQG
eukprot:506644_1